MLIEVDSVVFGNLFSANPHPFISDQFIKLNSNKVERVIRLVPDSNKPALGFVAGVRNGSLLSPFSAPFGGFHFRKETIYINEIFDFVDSLKDYISSTGLKGVELILPPDIYHFSFNAKAVNALIHKGFQLEIPDITNWVYLEGFNDLFKQRNSREYYKQAVKHGLKFELADAVSEQKQVFDLIAQNRAMFGRPIFMNFNDILNTSKLWPVDFFKISTPNGELVASAIFYRFHSQISYAVFWGDNEIGRSQRSMDFLAFNLWVYYKRLGFKYIDLGTSTEKGDPNEGLLRFKESHEATSSLRFRFSWYP